MHSLAGTVQTSLGGLTPRRGRPPLCRTRAGSSSRSSASGPPYQRPQQRRPPRRHPARPPAPPRPGSSPSPVQRRCSRRCRQPRRLAPPHGSASRPRWRRADCSARRRAAGASASPPRRSWRLSRASCESRVQASRWGGRRRGASQGAGARGVGSKKEREITDGDKRFRRDLEKEVIIHVSALHAHAHVTINNALACRTTR